MTFRRHTGWRALPQRIDKEAGIAEGTVELQRAWLGPMSNRSVVAARCGADTPVVQVKPRAEARVGPVFSNADFGRLEATVGDTIEVRDLTWVEVGRRTGSRAVVPALALAAAFLALLAALSPGPSDATRRHVALREAVQPVGTALKSLESAPARTLRAAQRAAREVTHGRTGARQAAATLRHLATDEQASEHDAAVITQWRTAALKARGSTDTSVSDAATIAAAVAALAAAALAAVKALRE